jgi:hypothetical protein
MAIAPGVALGVDERTLCSVPGRPTTKASTSRVAAATVQPRTVGSVARALSRRRLAVADVAG